jgi:hypothetical protein
MTMTSAKRPEALKRRAESGGGPLLSPAHPSNPLWSESLFNRISRISLFNGVAATRIGELVQETFFTDNPLQTYLSDQAGDQHGAPLEELLTLLVGGGAFARRDLETMTLSGFLTLEEVSRYGYLPHSPLLTSTLRYCHRCLALGFHSMLYQHGAVTVCPFHRVPLLSVCVDCKRPWKPSVTQIILSPYTCPSCDWLYWRSVPPKGAEEDLRRVSAAVTDCWRDLKVEERVRWERVEVRALDEFRSAEQGTALSVRRIQRATAWPKLPNHSWQRFRETHIEVGMECWPRAGALRPLNWQDIERGPTETLRWLRHESHAPASQSRDLVDGSWQRIQYITPMHRDRSLGVVATALHMVMCRYGWQRIDYRGVMRGHERDQPYANVSWNGARSESTPLNFGAASGSLVSAEILSYFVLCLLRCAGLNPLRGPVGDPCTAFYIAADYCPTWLLFRSSRTGWAVRYRMRATKKLVRWLLKRYRDRPLQRMVSCSWNSSPVFAELASINAPEYAPELLQFPRKVPAPPTETRSDLAA